MAFTTDLRHSVRLLRRSPIFTLTSIISLALGIGAAATIFSLTDALLFEPTVGVQEPSRMVDIGRANNGSGFDNMAHPTYARDPAGAAGRLSVTVPNEGLGVKKPALLEETTVPS